MTDRYRALLRAASLSTTTATGLLEIARATDPSTSAKFDLGDALPDLAEALSIAFELTGFDSGADGQLYAALKKWQDEHR